ncbi:MAG TPA: hypothetical protein VJI12_01295 [archaeon]|nr:hypothetical protein [archaeon]
MPLWSQREKDNKRAENIVSYYDRAKVDLFDKYIRGYTKITVGSLDYHLDGFAGFTVAKLNAGEPQQGAYIVPMTRTKRGIHIDGRKEQLLRSKAIILGNENPSEQLQTALSELKKQFDLDGVLYITLTEEGQQIDHMYVNHERNNTEIPPLDKKQPAKAELKSTDKKSESVA